MAPVTRAAKSAATRAKKGEAAGTGPSTSTDVQPSNVVYVGHIPHGFYEKQMQEYFSQFGRVTKVRLSRNKKSGASKHYAFLQFYSPEVARIAAEAMDGYMFVGQKISSHVIPSNEVHPELFKGANRVFKVVPWGKIERARQNAERTPQAQKRLVQRAVKRDHSRQQKIKEAGIDYEYEGLDAKRPKRATHTTFPDEDDE